MTNRQKRAGVTVLPVQAKVVADIHVKLLATGHVQVSTNDHLMARTNLACQMLREAILVVESYGKEQHPIIVTPADVLGNHIIS